MERNDKVIHPSGQKPMAAAGAELVMPEAVGWPNLKLRRRGEELNPSTRKIRFQKPAEVDEIYLVVSLNGGTPQTPQNDHFQ